MKKLLITALVLGAGLTACSGDKKDDADNGGTETTQDGAAKAQLATLKVAGMT